MARGPPIAGARNARSSNSPPRRFLPKHDQYPFFLCRTRAIKGVGRAASQEPPAQASQGGPMFRRRSRSNQAKRAARGRLPSSDEVRDQVAEVTDELGLALDTARDAIAKAMSSAGRRGTEAGAEATRKTAMVGKEAGRRGMAASRRARGATLEAVGRRLPEPEHFVFLAPGATEKVFPERAKHHRKAAR